MIAWHGCRLPVEAGRLVALRGQCDSVRRGAPPRCRRMRPRHLKTGCSVKAVITGRSHLELAVARTSKQISSEALEECIRVRVVRRRSIGRRETGSRGSSPPAGPAWRLCCVRLRHEEYAVAVCGPSIRCSVVNNSRTALRAGKRRASRTLVVEGRRKAPGWRSHASAQGSSPSPTYRRHRKGSVSTNGLLWHPPPGRNSKARASWPAHHSHLPTPRR